MPDEYGRAILRMVIAQICQMIGWQSINCTPLEFLVDMTQEYLLQISKIAKQYAEVLGRTEANLDDLGLAFQHMHVLIPELSEYVKNVDSVPCVIAVPKFPVCRENHLNFLKPGSQEVVTRSVHVHEHLPAMYPNTEDPSLIDKEEVPISYQIDSSIGGVLSPEESVNTSPNQTVTQSMFKRPGGLLSSEHHPHTKRSKIVEEGRPLREIHSVIMTTSGFLSPAREGKLPEPRTPHPVRADSPPASSYPMVPPELKIEKKLKKIIKKGPDERKVDKENKKKNRVKELFKPDNISDLKAKKIANMKEHTKLKSKSSCNKSHSGNSSSSSTSITPQLTTQKENCTKTTKLFQCRVKPERSLEVASAVTPSEHKEDNIDKLPSEPDKQKLNIFKKISKPREEKSVDGAEQLKHKELDSSECSPGLIIDEISEKYVQRRDTDIKREEKKISGTLEVQIYDGGEVGNIQSPLPDVYMFGDMSPPGTPSTPKTPELSVPLPFDLKRKRKERNIRKKESRLKSPKRSPSPKKKKNAGDIQDLQLCDRPKTPQAVVAESHKESSNLPPCPFPFFSPFPPAPGLIPHPMNQPMFPRYPLTLGRTIPGAHPAMPNLPMPPRFLSSNIRLEDSLLPKMMISDHNKEPSPLLADIRVPHPVPEKLLKPVVEKVVKPIKTEKEFLHQSTASITPRNDSINFTAPLANAPSVSSASQLAPKNEKLDKNSKKSREHKKERKEKLKKKKDKKEKHKIKDKNKGRKGKITKLKDKKEKKDKRKDKGKEDKTAEAVPKITLKLGTASPQPPTPENTSMKKITIKPLVKKSEEETKRDASPELAKISALVTRPPKQKLPKLKTDPSPKKNDGINEKENAKDVTTINLDQSSRQVWICPACGNQDDGSPMIGCDDCDAWYHWVCVGVQVPPADHEDWYCRLCLAKKQELHHDKKKEETQKESQSCFIE